MSDVVIVGLLSLVGTIIGTLGGIIATSRLTTYRIEQLEKNVDTRCTDFHDILQTISDTLNKGQRKKLLKNEKIKKAFDFFKVDYEG